jgi:MinD-like ATPase involved in chromosome partitioning or flagellar assembly
MLKLSSIFSRAKPDSSQDGTIGVVVAAPPDLTQPFMSLIPGNSSGVQIVTTSRDAADLPDDIRNFKPQVVLIAPDIRGYKHDVVAQLANWPDFPIAVIGLVPTSGAWGAEMVSHGAVAFYNTPITPAVVEQFTRQVHELIDVARERWSKPVADSGVSRQTIEAVGASAYRTGVIVFWSTKGGDGKTTLAVNVACLLSLVAGKKVLLVDADMNCGRVALHLDIPPGQNTILHLASDYRANDNAITGKMLKRRAAPADRFLDPRTKAVESRLDVLFGITHIQQATSDELYGRQGQQFISEVLRLSRELYDFVIVDMGSSTQMGPHFGSLQSADLVMVVNTSDRSSLYHNRQTLQVLAKEADLRPDKFKLVMNRYDPDDRIDLNDVTDFMRMPIFATVPENRSRQVIASINEGKPFVLTHMGRNPPDDEATLRGLLAIAEGIFPPMGRIIAERGGKTDGGKFPRLAGRGWFRRK